MPEKRFSKVCSNRRDPDKWKRVAAVVTGLLLSSSPAGAISSFKRFDLPSAIVNYEINGSGKLTESSTLTIRGHAALLFAEWGARKLYKEKYSEVTAGAVKNKKTIRRLYREDHGEVYRADFEKNKIDRGEDAIIKKAIATGEDLYHKMIEEMNANGERTGSSTVLGYRCREWLYKGKKRCLYRGIPLMEESIISGVKVIKRAVSVKFDINISDDAFAFPDFKEREEKGFLLGEKEKVALRKKVASNEKRERDLPEEAEESAASTKLTLIDEGDDLAKNMFEKQKAYLPKLLSEMKEARVCLENADTVEDANRCLSKLVEIEEKMSGEKSSDREITTWAKRDQEKTKSDLEESILDMRRRMPCIRRSRNFEDLSVCMQESQVD